jgi:cytidylate kinase
MIITLSWQLGSGGDTIARRVATALGLLLVDREYIWAAASASGVPAGLLQRLLYEGPRSLAGQFLENLGGEPVDRASGTPPPPSPLGGIFVPVMPPASLGLQEAVSSIGLIVKEIASRDNAVILGQGGQAWLRGYAGVCHLQVVAPFAVRVARLAAQDLAPEVARRRVRANDLARADYMARYHEVNWLDPMLYHLVINTGLTPIEAAVALVASAADAIGHRT